MPDGYARNSHAIQSLIYISDHARMRQIWMIRSDKLHIILLLTFITVVGVKAYAIGIVWRCYKYLILRQQCMRSILPIGLGELAANGILTNVNEQTYSNILPNYDEAIAQYLKQAPPPPYQVAMANFLGQQQQRNVELAISVNNVENPPISNLPNDTLPVYVSNQSTPNGGNLVEGSYENNYTVTPQPLNYNTDQHEDNTVFKDQIDKVEIRLGQSTCDPSKSDLQD